MGNSASKSARRLPKSVSQGSRLQAGPSAGTGTSQSQAQAQAQARRAEAETDKAMSGIGRSVPRDQSVRESARDTKDQSIMDDAADPHFLRNLSQIGQVNVPRHATNFQPNDQMLRILASRRQTASIEDPESEDYVAPASGSLHNRLTAPSLSAMLDERKSAKTRAELEEIAKAYDVDLDIMERLARFVNSPSVAAIEEKQRGPEDEDKPQKMLAVWVDAPVEDEKRRIGVSSQ